MKKMKTENSKYARWARATIATHKHRGYTVLINIDDLISLAKETTRCSICNRILSWSNNVVGNTSPSIDRIDNENIMRMDNTQIVCHQCNRNKSSMSMREFIHYCKTVVGNMEGKNYDITNIDLLETERKRLIDTEKKWKHEIILMKKVIEELENDIK